MKRTLHISLFLTAFISAASFSYAQQPDTTSVFSVVEVLDEAVATAEKSKIVYRLDRQKLSGSASISAAFLPFRWILKAA